MAYEIILVSYQPCSDLVEIGTVFHWSCCYLTPDDLVAMSNPDLMSPAELNESRRLKLRSLLSRLRELTAEVTKGIRMVAKPYKYIDFLRERCVGGLGDIIPGMVSYQHRLTDS
jgi:hypothetical protein